MKRERAAFSFLLNMDRRTMFVAAGSHPDILFGLRMYKVGSRTHLRDLQMIYLDTAKSS